MAMQATQQQWIRVEDLDAIELPEKFVEIIEGELIEMTAPSWRHNRIASNIEFLFREFCATRPALAFGGDNEGFLLKRRPLTMLSPDACLFRRRQGLEEMRCLEFGPEIAVEILSQSNHPTEMVFKRHAFFDAGTEQFWLVDPGKREIVFHHRDGHIVTVSGDEVVEGEGIAQGIQISLQEVFRVS